MREILYKFQVSEISHGFVPGKSPKTNAEKHVGKKYLLTLDIRNFFNSITYNDILYLLKNLLEMTPSINLNLEWSDIEAITELITLNGKLPQGVCTSPAASNLFMFKFDEKLQAFAILNNFVITRYADDIAISSNKRINVKEVIDFISKNLNSNLFLQHAKTKVRGYYHRQKVTGIVVNEKLNVERNTWRNLRARLHQLYYKDTPPSDQELAEVRGKIEWVKSLNPCRGEKFLETLEKIYMKHRPCF
jgi:RNA-directed DNA polymerase